MQGADVAVLLGRYGEVVGITAAPRMGKAFVRMASAEGARNAAAAFNASERGRGVPYGIRAALPEEPDAETIQEAAEVMRGVGGVTARPTIWHEQQWREGRERGSGI